MEKNCLMRSFLMRVTHSVLICRVEACIVQTSTARPRLLVTLISNLRSSSLFTTSRSPTWFIWTDNLNSCTHQKVKMKFTYTHWWALGPELIPVYRQSASRWLKSSPGGRLLLLFTRPAVTFAAENINVLRPVPSYTAWWQRHNLPKVVTQRCPRWELKPHLMITSPTLYC